MPCDDSILSLHIRIADALKLMFPNDLEIIIHDLRQPEKSIIHIVNGHITGRKVGDGTSDIGYKRLSGEVDDLLHYSNTSPGGAPLKSVSQAIRNDAGDIIGAFSMNLDISKFQQIESIIENFLAKSSVQETLEKEQFFYLEAKDSIKSVIDSYLEVEHLSLQSLNREQKKQLVLFLQRKGLFKAKASVSTVSAYIGLSRATIYRYIS